MIKQNESLNFTPIDRVQKQLKGLKSTGLVASPRSGREHFWVDLWNEIVEVVSLQISKSNHFAENSKTDSLSIYENELKSLNIHEPIFTLISKTSEIDSPCNSFYLDSSVLLRQLNDELSLGYFTETNWQIKFRDGMLVIVESGISRVICILDETFFPQPEMIADLISVVYMAKITGVHVNKIQTGIAKICGFDVIKTTKDTFTGSEFIDFSEVSSFDDALRILRYFDENPIVVLGGDYDNIPQTFGEQLITSAATLVHIRPAAQAQILSLKKFIDIYQVDNVSEAIQTVYRVTEQRCEILFLAGIEKKPKEQIKLSQEFFKEVIS